MAKEKAPPAPVLWKFASGSKWHGGLLVDKRRCWLGNDDCVVFALDHDGKIQKHIKLPGYCGIDSFASDGKRVLAVNAGGGVYDMSAARAKLAYPLMQVQAIGCSNGSLVVARVDGCYALDGAGQFRWGKLTKEHGSDVCCDQRAAYFLAGRRLFAYNMENGAALWSRPLNGNGRTVCRSDARVYADSGGGGQVCSYDKQSGKLVRRYVSGESLCECLYSCASSPDDALVFAASNSGYLCIFTGDGRQLGILATAVGTALQMVFAKDRLYVAGFEGAMACIDARPDALQGALKGKRPKPKVIPAVKYAPGLPVEPRPPIQWVEWPAERR